MLLHIVRHGQTHWNAQRRIQGHSESELDETGVAQCIERSKDFANTRFAAVYSSPSVRTRQTTHYLLNGETDNVIYRDGLKEITLGVWEGQLWPDIEKQFPEQVALHLSRSDEFDVEGAERHSEVQQRGAQAIESIVEDQTAGTQNTGSEKEILVVSHGAIIKTILAHYANVPLIALRNLPSLPNCAHCILSVNAGSRRVIQVAGEAIEHSAWAEFAS